VPVLVGADEREVEPVRDPRRLLLGPALIVQGLSQQRRLWAAATAAVLPAAGGALRLFYFLEGQKTPRKKIRNERAEGIKNAGDTDAAEEATRSDYGRREKHVFGEQGRAVVTMAREIACSEPRVSRPPLKRDADPQKRNVKTAVGQHRRRNSGSSLASLPERTEKGQATPPPPNNARGARAPCSSQTST